MKIQYNGCSVFKLAIEEKYVRVFICLFICLCVRCAPKRED